MEVKRSGAVARKCADAGRTPFHRMPGNKRSVARSSLQRDVLPTRGEMTMSTKLAMAFAAVIVASALPALAASNANRDNEYTYKLAQFCVPQHDELPGATRVYC
jgi:hypothetical protein